jgi:hypothetical protein
MPRKLRNPKRRRGSTPDVSPALYCYLLWGDHQAAKAMALEDKTNPWELFDSFNDSHSVAWHSILDEALAEWIEVYPGERPASWWLWTAPSLRNVYGRFRHWQGSDRCHQTGIPHGQPDDPEDLPMVESTPAFLDRLGLWIPGERSRVPAEAFEPSPFSVTLTASRHGVTEGH